MTDCTQKGETCRAAQHNSSFSGAGDPVECGWPTCFCYQHDREVVEELREQGWIDGGEAWKLRNEIATLQLALEPFAKLADSWTVQTAAKEGALLTVSNGQRMCGISADAFIQAEKVVEPLRAKVLRNPRRLA